MTSDPQGRKWQLTWNNPQFYGLTRDAVLEILSYMSGRFSGKECAQWRESAETKVAVC